MTFLYFLKCIVQSIVNLITFRLASFNGTVYVPSGESRIRAFTGRTASGFSSVYAVRSNCSISIYARVTAYGNPSIAFNIFSYRWRTRSWISWVRPWFQYCVPMYPHVRRATFIVVWSVLPQLGHFQTSLLSPSFSILISPV